MDRAFAPAPYSTVGKKKSVISLPLDAAHCAYGQAVQGAALLPAGADWTTANTAVIYKFVVWEDCTVYKLGFMTAGSPLGNNCIALYNATTLARLVTTGIITTSTNVVQWTDTADTALVAGVPYLAAFNRNNVANTNGHSGANQTLGAQILGEVQQQAVGATTLPDPLVPATMTVVRHLPIVVLATVSGWS